MYGAEVARHSGIYGFEEFMGLRLERPKPVIEGLVNSGQNTIFAGPFGIGKTMLTLPMSMCLASGKDFVGRRVLRPFKTAFIDFENDPGEIQGRLRSQKQALSLSVDQVERLEENWTYSNTNQSGDLHRLNLRKPDSRGILEDFIHKRDTEVLIIDNLGRAFGELSEPEEVEDFYEILSGWRERHAALSRGVIFFLHHLVKPVARKGQPPILLLKEPYEYLGAVRGSGRLLDYAENRLAISREKVGGVVAHVVNGVNRSTKLRPLVLNLDAKTLSFEPRLEEVVRFEQVFQKSPRQKELFMQLPETFSFKDAANLQDPEGKTFCRGTVAATLTVAVENELLFHDEESRMYSKVPVERSAETR
jgi:hypothetical protein